MFVPANILPMLRTATLVEKTESTIVGGVVELIHYGNYGIAAIVFIASIMIPVGKFIAIAYLAISVQRKSQLNQHQRHRLYEVVEFIGRWSMIDVFVVAILSALVQRGQDTRCQMIPTLPPQISICALRPARSGSGCHSSGWCPRWR